MDIKKSYNFNVVPIKVFTNFVNLFGKLKIIIRKIYDAYLYETDL